MRAFGERILRAAKLDQRLYEEVENDKTSLSQATMVVVLSSAAAAVGGARGHLSIGSFVASGLVALLAWYVWAYLTYLIGTRLLPEPGTEADLGQLLRTTGFSSAPGLIQLFGIIPGFAGIVFVAAWVWMLMAMVIAIRQALDYSTTARAVGVCVIGWLIQLFILLIFFQLTERPLFGVRG
jgi:hypothetical protein